MLYKMAEARRVPECESYRADYRLNIIGEKPGELKKYTAEIIAWLKFTDGRVG